MMEGSRSAVAALRKGVQMRLMSQLLLASVALSTVGLLSAAPASAAVISCSASLNVDDSDVRVDTKTGPGPCSLQFVARPEGPNATIAIANSFAFGARFIQADALADVQTSHFVGLTGATTSFDQVRVSGLDDGGADITFDIFSTYVFVADASDPNRFSRATATSQFRNQATVSADGRVANALYTGCVKNDTPGISVCNGAFDVTEPGSGSVHLYPTIHLLNGELLNINLSVLAAAVGHAPQSDNFAMARTTSSLSWRGVRFGSSSLRLLNSDGVDYTQPFSAGVPEPTTWALMLLGFGAAGAVLRRRRLAV